MDATRRRWAWPALPGPVFRRELGSLARGRWLYLVRALAAVALVYFVAASSPLRELLAGGMDWSPLGFGRAARGIFIAFGAAQFTVILALTPALVAASVAEEKAGGTLGLVLAGRLGSLEIVADKLAARMMLVLVVVAAGAPVLALIGLMGGIDPGELTNLYEATLAAAWFAAGLAMLVSVHARSAAGAVVGAYLACLAWAFLPVWASNWLGTTGPPGPEAWLREAARGLAKVSPLSIAHARDIWGPSAFTLAGRARMVHQMAGLHALGGLAWLLLAAWRLRPAYRAQAGGPVGKRTRLGWLARLAGFRGRPKPPCGDDPMAWKERHAPEAAGLARVVLLVGLVPVLQAIRLHFFTYPEFVGLAFDELFAFGSDLGPSGLHGGGRNQLNHVLCEQAATLFFASLAAATILAASGIAGERARGTWPGLLTTPLDRRGIVRAKMWGAVGPVRGPLGLMLVFQLGSLAATALHPIGLVLVTAAEASSLGFAVALGTWVSAHSKRPARAIARAVPLLAAASLAPAALLYPSFGPNAIVATPPALVMILPISTMKARTFAAWISSSPAEGRILPFLFAVVLAQAAGAWALARLAARRVERVEG